MAQLDSLGIQLFQFAVNHRPEYLQQSLDLVLGAGPVFSGKSINGEVLDPEIHAAFDHPAQVFGTGTVTFNARHAAALRPAAVAIHDNGNVCGDILLVNLGLVFRHKILNFHDLFFFSLTDGIDLFNLFISELLHFFFTVYKIVFGDQFFVFEFFQVLD